MYLDPNEQKTIFNNNTRETDESKQQKLRPHDKKYFYTVTNRCYAKAKQLKMTELVRVAEFVKKWTLRSFNTTVKFHVS